MSKVIRLSDETLKDLDFFHCHFLNQLKEEVKEHKESDFLCSLLKEKIDYTDNQWVAFAIRFAANHVDN